MSRKTAAASYAAAILVLLVLFARMQGPVKAGLVVKELLNFAHVPVFGVVAAALLGLCGTLFGSRLTRAQQYLLAFGLAVTLGAISEALQIYGERDSDPWDFARNVVGSSSALLLLAAVDRSLPQRGLFQRCTTRHLFAATAAALLIVAALPLILLGEAYRQREARFPVLCRFDSEFELRLMGTRNVTLELTSPPTSWGLSDRRRVGRATYYPSRYPAVLLHDPHPDWEGHGFLELDLYLEGEEAARINIRIDDEHHNMQHDDRYTGGFDLRPGTNHLRIPLTEVRGAPATRSMDMQKISVVVLYTVEPAHPFTVYFADLRLAPL